MTPVRIARAGAVVAAVVLIAGCAQGAGAVGGAPSGGPAPSSVACPIQEGVELPEECIPYDPQALMDSNERYRDRMPVSAEAFAAFEAVREDVESGVERLRRDDALTPEAVRAVLEAVGAEVGEAYEIEGTIFVLGNGPAGGCVEGRVDAEVTEIDAVGFIMDGGCIALSGH